VGLLRVKKDPFRDRGLSCVNMGHEPNISRSGEAFLSGHLFSLPSGENISWQY